MKLSFADAQLAHQPEQYMVHVGGLSAPSGVELQNRVTLMAARTTAASADGT